MGSVGLQYVAVSANERLDAEGRPPRSRSSLRALARLVVLGVVTAGFLLPVVGPVALGAREAADSFEELPEELPIAVTLPQRATLTDAEGKVFATLYSENRVPVALDDVAPVVIDAVLATEDDRFYEHGPMDVRGNLRAVLNNTRTDDLQGASSITQQYVKNILLTNAVTQRERTAVTSQTLGRKLRELRYAAALEQKMSKDDILAGYLNVAYFGGRAYGVGAAAEYYFGTTADRLTLPQAAMLAGLLQDPSGYDPTRNPEAARDRRATVLSRMAATGRITAAEARAANRSDLELDVSVPSRGCAASKYEAYCEYVRQTILDNPVFGATAQAREQFLFRGGFTVRTALDPDAMKAANNAARRALSPKNRVAAAVAVVQPGTGAVTAIGSNRPWGSDKKKGETQLVYAALPAYQPGSTFKPITLATALEQGFNMRSRLNSPSPYSPPGLDSPVGGFRNDDRRSRGAIDAYAATANSVNTWYVELIRRTGVLPVADMAGRLGISSLPRTGPRAVKKTSASLTLGSYEVSPVEMAAAYATFAADGIACRPTPILRITDAAGKKLPAPDPGCHREISPGVASVVTSALRGPLQGGGTAAGLGVPGRDSAGKTGTTNDNGATWFVGYTPQYATAVWVGDPRGPQNELRGVTAYGRYYGQLFGATVAAPIWKDVMTKISDGLPKESFRPPDPAVLAGATTRFPSVVGLERDAAITTLAAQGYRVRVAPQTAEPNDLVGPGFVAAQSPEGGKSASYGAVVTLTLTAGSDTNVAAPNPARVPR